MKPRKAIDPFSVDGFAQVMKLIEDTVAPVLEKRGVKIVSQKRRNSPKSGEVLLTLAKYTPSGEFETARAMDWKLWHREFDLPADGLGKTVILRGQPYIVTGVRPNANKDNVYIQSKKNGKEYVSPHTLIGPLLKMGTRKLRDELGVGDRVIVDASFFEDNQEYHGVVKKVVEGTKLLVKFDDGDRETVPRRQCRSE